MSRDQHLDAYARGWQAGDIGTIMSSLADGYVFDVPTSGKIPKDGMEAYFGEFSAAIADMCGGPAPDPFMELTEIVTADDGETLTAWCWWAIPGTPMGGGGLIKVGDDGVRSEIITFYAPPAEPGG
ncbi:MAG: nuclear transport factor 2 family protein [Alphaproteobacteria bacterium]|nr:nuclear transport factor 2 family protein [Alphaproteobacteria bacterium]